MEPDDPPPLPEPVLPKARAIRLGGKPLELQKQLLRQVDYKELVEASTTTTLSAKRMVKEIARSHLLSPGRCWGLRRRVEDIQVGHRVAMKAILEEAPDSSADDATWATFGRAMYSLAVDRQ